MIPLRRNQNGIALIISLVILLLLSLLGALSLKSAALQENMTSSSQQKTMSFHLAESSVGKMIRNIHTNNQNNGEDMFFYPDYNAEAEVHYSYVGTVPAVGWSMNSGTGASMFIITSLVIINTGTRTSIEQGIYRINPPSNI